VLLELYLIMINNHVSSLANKGRYTRPYVRGVCTGLKSTGRVDAPRHTRCHCCVSDGI